jgi:hypothetical protein
MKEQFENALIEIVSIENTDIIITSDWGAGDEI